MVLDEEIPPRLKRKDRWRKWLTTIVLWFKNRYQSARQSDKVIAAAKAAAILAVAAVTVGGIATAGLVATGTVANPFAETTEPDTLSAPVAELQRNVDELSAASAALAEQLVANEPGGEYATADEIAALRNDLVLVRTELAETGLSIERVTELETRVFILVERLVSNGSVLDSDIGTLELRLIQLEASGASAADLAAVLDMVASARQVKDLSDKVDAASAAVTSSSNTLADAVATSVANATDIGKLRSDIGTVTSALNQLSTRVDSLSVVAVSNSTSLADAQRNIIELASTLELVLVNISGIETRLTNIESALGSSNTAVADLRALLGANSSSDVSNIATLDTRILDVLSRANTNTSDIAALDVRISCLHDQIPPEDPRCIDQGETP